jgi:hypothetical protein
LIATAFIDAAFIDTALIASSGAQCNRPRVPCSAPVLRFSDGDVAGLTLTGKFPAGNVVTVSCRASVVRVGVRFSHLPT